MPQKVIVIAGKDPSEEHRSGGFETYVRAFGRAAIRAGYEPHLFAVSDRSGTSETDYGTLHRVYSPVRPFRGLMVRLHAPFLTAGVNRFCHDIGPPYLLHGFGPWSAIGATVAEGLRRRGRAVLLATPFTTYLHETLAKVEGLQENYSWPLRIRHRMELWWTSVMVSPLERRGFRAADEVLPSYASVRRIIEVECGAGIRFGHMQYASEAAFIRREDEALPPLPAGLMELLPRNAPLIVSVSRHDARKGLAVLLFALSDLKRQGVAFRACLAGGGPLADEHRRLAASLGLRANVLIPGWVDDAFGLLRRADIFVLPSLEEGSGSVSLLEAMQAGVAPIVSRVDGLPEDIDHEESGLLVEPGDRAQLVEALRRCLTDPDLRQRLADGAQARYRRDFSAGGFAADVARIYAAHGFAGSASSEPSN